MAIPALVKVLNEPQNERLCSSVWESIGHMGKECDALVFKEIFSIISSIKSAPISEVGFRLVLLRILMTRISSYFFLQLGSYLVINKPLLGSFFESMLGLFLDTVSTSTVSI